VVPFDRPWVPSKRFARRGGGLLLLVLTDSKPKISARELFLFAGPSCPQIRRRRRRR